MAHFLQSIAISKQVGTLMKTSQFRYTILVHPLICHLKSIKSMIFASGSVCGRVVTFYNRGPQFDFVSETFYIDHLFTVNCILKTKIKKNRPEMTHFKKKLSIEMI